MRKDKKKHFNPANIDTMIGAETVVEGNVICSGTVRIDGKVKGDVTAKGDIYIGKSASVIGDLSADNVDVSGSIEGNVAAKGILRMHSSANLTGDIQVHSFVADEGALFHGNCSMAELTADEGRYTDASIEGKHYGKNKKHHSKDYIKSGTAEESYDEEH